MKVLSTLTFVLLLLVLPPSASAGIQPSFYAEECSWRATDIVVVTEGQKIDGIFEVLETWKGDLQPGETITIPEMAAFKAKDARLIDKWSWLQKEKEPPEYVTGARMILFLRDAKKVPEDLDRDKQANTTSSRWIAANLIGSEIKYSTVWIDKGKLNWFVQQINPGPSLLSRIKTTETELKTEVFSVLSTQNSLKAALAIADPALRAEGLEPFTHHTIYRAKEQAFTALAECGEAALPVLRRMLHNDSLRKLHAKVIETFAKASRKTAGPELTTWVETEFEFWKQTAPSLEVGWWNGKGLGVNQFDGLEMAEPLRDRWMALYQAVQALGEIRYTNAERVLSEVRDFWRSLPQLYNDQISEACDKILREFGANRKEGKRTRVPKYEISFTGNRVFSSAVLTAKMAEYVSEYDQLEKDTDLSARLDQFRYALRRVNDFISGQGYLNVSFTSSQKTTEHGEVLSVTIDEGDQYRLGKIKIQGAKLIPAAQIRAMLALREGDIADETALGKWLHDLRKAYREVGYFDYYAEDDHEFRSDADVADIKIVITEGAQYKVASIKFEGTTNITKDQLNAAMLIREGETFSQTKLDESINALNKLGLKLDKGKDVGVVENNSNTSVTIMIVLNRDRYPNESVKP